MKKRIALLITVILIVTGLLGCTTNDYQNNKEDTQLQEQEEISENNDENEEGKIHNWTGKITSIDKNNNQEGYSKVSWSGLEGGGRFTIEDSLVYEKYNLEVGEYIDVVAQNIPFGLKIISIDKIEERTALKGIIENIEIDKSKIYIKISDKEMFNEVATININKDTEFTNTVIEELKKGDIIRAKGILGDKTLDSYEVILESPLSIN